MQSVATPAFELGIQDATKLEHHFAAVAPLCRQLPHVRWAEDEPEVEGITAAGLCVRSAPMMRTLNQIVAQAMEQHQLSLLCARPCTVKCVTPLQSKALPLRLSL